MIALVGQVARDGQKVGRLGGHLIVGTAVVILEPRPPDQVSDSL